MGVLCVVPARGGSLRAPGKNIRPLAGRPLMAYSIGAALESSLADMVVVSTDDAGIAGVARSLGVRVVDRPPELASHDAALDDALRHAVMHLEESDGFKADIVVSLQANVPVRKPGEIDAAIEKLRGTPEATAVVTVYKVDQRPEWMKKMDPETGRLMPHMEPTAAFRMQDLPPLYLLDGAIVAVRTEVLMSTVGDRTAHAWFGERVHALEHDRRYAIEIDEPDDFEFAECFLRTAGGHGPEGIDKG